MTYLDLRKAKVEVVDSLVVFATGIGFAPVDSHNSDWDDLAIPDYKYSNRDHTCVVAIHNVLLH